MEYFLILLISFLLPLLVKKLRLFLISKQRVKESQHLDISQNEYDLLNDKKAKAEKNFTTAAMIIAALPILIGVIGFAVTPDDNRVLNPFFVLAIFASISLFLSYPFTIAYIKLFTTKDDSTAIFILWLPFIPTFILGVSATVLIGIAGFIILIPSTIAMIIMTMALLSKRNQFDKEYFDLKTAKNNSTKNDVNKVLPLTDSTEQ